jgi:hypothetical protein
VSLAYASEQDDSGIDVAASIDAQLLWHPSRAFFVGVGPGLSHDFFAPHSFVDSTGASTSGEAPHHTRIRFLAFTLGGVL